MDIDPNDIDLDLSDIEDPTEAERKAFEEFCESGPSSAENAENQDRMLLIAQDMVTGQAVPIVGDGLPVAGQSEDGFTNTLSPYTVKAITYLQLNPDAQQVKIVRIDTPAQHQYLPITPEAEEHFAGTAFGDEFTLNHGAILVCDETGVAPPESEDEAFHIEGQVERQVENGYPDTAITREDLTDEVMRAYNRLKRVYT